MDIFFQTSRQDMKAHKHTRKINGDICCFILTDVYEGVMQVRYKLKQIYLQTFLRLSILIVSRNSSSWKKVIPNLSVHLDIKSKNKDNDQEYNHNLGSVAFRKQSLRKMLNKKDILIRKCVVLLLVVGETMPKYTGK